LRQLPYLPASGQAGQSLVSAARERGTHIPDLTMAIDYLDGPMLPPANGATATAAVVMLHGYGADGNDLIGLAPSFARVLPGTVFYSPHAPTPMDGGFGGRQWFSLAGYDPERISRNPRAALTGPLPQGMEDSAARLRTFLDRILETHRLTMDRLALVGFSQGTMMSLHVGLRLRTPLAGIVGYSGALMAPDRLAAEIRSKPPVLLIHGTADPVVPMEALAEAESTLKAAGITVQSHRIPGLGHGIDMTGAALAEQFLKEKLA
jgi:phospholipase/carboxylesterase